MLLDQDDPLIGCFSYQTSKTKTQNKPERTDPNMCMGRRHQPWGLNRSPTYSYTIAGH
jgi:hypothetical protein